MRNDCELPPWLDRNNKKNSNKRTSNKNNHLQHHDENPYYSIDHASTRLKNMAPNIGRASSPSAVREANERLSDYNKRYSTAKSETARSEVEEQSGVSPEEYAEIEQKFIIPALASRSFHLPGNSVCDDWFQYLFNTHPILGICFHHPLHPVTMRMRIINLFGSIVFGLTITNLIWLWFAADQAHDPRHVVFSMSVGERLSNATASHGGQTFRAANLELTEGIIILWTVGGGLHAVFDNTVWYLSACYCCLPGQALSCLEQYRWCGTYFVVIAVVACTALASFVIALRATLDNSDVATDDDGYVASQIDSANISFAQGHKYEFILGYVVEFFLAVMVYYPIIATVLFSGVLGCGQLPVLGGRPYSKRRYAEWLERRQSRRHGTFETEDSWDEIASLANVNDGQTGRRR